MAIRLCQRCGSTVVTADQAPHPDGVQHKGDCPARPRKDTHRGKKFAGIQSQVKVADMCKEIRSSAVIIKHDVEHGNLGTAHCREAAVLLKLLAEDIIKECDGALERRKHDS